MKRYLKIAAITLAMCTTALMSCNKDGDEVTTYTVTFDADGGTPVPSVQSVEAGKTAPYKFGGRQEDLSSFF
ncbi:MAG: InlB B-repeat-containing protein [Tannerellaceae bacterium]|nr:InlB B-repeat-containing protein [Tannerellaceae bacterium]